MPPSSTVQIVNVIYPFFISSEFFVIHFMFGMLMCYLVYDYKDKAIDAVTLFLLLVQGRSGRGGGGIFGHGYPPF